MWGQKKYVGAAPNQTDQKTTGHVSISSLVVKIWLLLWNGQYFTT
jgi:hypothetical protein